MKTYLDYSYNGLLSNFQNPNTKHLKLLEELPPLFPSANARIIKPNINNDFIAGYMIEDRFLNKDDIDSYSQHDFNYKKVEEVEK